MAIDPSELASLWRSHAPSLTMLARARCRHPDDCVQIAFIRLASLADTPRDPIAWLTTVVRNEAISQLRSELRRSRRESVAVQHRTQYFASQNAANSTPIDLMALASALDALAVDDREIVIAHLWTGLTFRQIADAFALSLSMVHRRYHAAIEELRAQMGSEASDPLQVKTSINSQECLES